MQPYRTDLSKLQVLMQGFQPCCVEAALTAAIEYYYFLKTGVYTPLSFRFLAAITASKDGINYATGGTKLEVALEVAKNVGVCTAATYPNDITISPTEFVELSLIPRKAYDEAGGFKIPDYKVLDDISWEAINAAIEAYKVVITSLYLDREWYLSNVPNSNPLPIPPPMGMTDPSISGHATLSFGFDASHRYFRNSFGSTFGQNGDGYYTSAYQPYIYKAGVIIDPILQTIVRQTTEVAADVDRLTASDPNEPQEETLIARAIGGIEKEIEAVL